jgi:hypothetical protein
MVAAWMCACTETPRAHVGESCSDHLDCMAAAQCFLDVCTPRCATHEDCGGGYLCSDDGTCDRVTSSIGDPCGRELDCGPQQTCRLDDVDYDRDGELAATCQLERNGNVTGSECAADGDCRSQTCSIGRCTEVCSGNADCGDGLACVVQPRPLTSTLATTAPTFRGCLQASGTLHHSLVGGPAAGDTPLRVVVPGNALSVSMVTRVDDPRLLVGARRVVDPDGEVLYDAPVGGGPGFYANEIRYEAARQISTLMIPNAPHIPLVTGVYQIQIATTHSDGTPAGEVPELTVVYKLGGEAATSALDLDFYFLDLADHACAAATTDATINATTAASSPEFAEYLAALQDILGAAGISIGAIGYHDIAGAPELDAIAPGELGTLLSMSHTDGGVNVFFVRSIEPIGVQALAGGTPGAPRMAGTPSSGIAVSADTLCYRDWPALARTTSHAIGKQLGLYRNVDPDGREDEIADSPSDATNLMYFSEFGGAELSQGQADVLRRGPVTR